MKRVFLFNGFLSGLPALGIAIAGNSGLGLVSGLRPLYEFFATMGMRAMEPLPATQFQFEVFLKRATELGRKVADQAGNRQIFKSIFKDSFTWYEQLPDIRLNLLPDFILLAKNTVDALPEESRGNYIERIQQAEEYALAENYEEAFEALAEVYNSCIGKLAENYPVITVE